MLNIEYIPEKRSGYSPAAVFYGSSTYPRKKVPPQVFVEK